MSLAQSIPNRPEIGFHAGSGWDASDELPIRKLYPLEEEKKYRELPATQKTALKPRVDAIDPLRHVPIAIDASGFRFLAFREARLSCER